MQQVQQRLQQLEGQLKSLDARVGGGGAGVLRDFTTTPNQSRAQTN
jgi:hypothetical protein